jgi:hypothetical protein
MATIQGTNLDLLFGLAFPWYFGFLILQPQNGQNKASVVVRSLPHLVQFIYGLLFICAREEMDFERRNQDAQSIRIPESGAIASLLENRAGLRVMGLDKVVQVTLSLG